MAPARSRSRSQSRSRSTPWNPARTEASVAAALKKLASELKLAKQEGTEIQLSDEILDPVNEILSRRRRENDTGFQPFLVADIISDLDDKDDDVCSRLKVPVYNTLLRLFLQTTGCPDVERGLYLLASILYHQAHSPRSPTLEEDLISTKESIGKDTLQSLLEFFTNAKNTAELRRWTGILLIQLLQGSNKNVENVELGSEGSRRNLGTMLSTEANDILRIICGHVIKELVDAEVPRESLWPAGTNEEICEGFPDSSQEGRWNQLLHNYLDDIDTSEDSDMLLYFVQDVCTKPPFHLERPGHTANVVTDFQTMTVWSPVSDTELDQFLDIALEDISTMTITTMQESQRPTGVSKIDFCIDGDEDKFCALNGGVAIIRQVSMVMLAVEAKHMKMDLSNLCPNLEIREINTSQESYGMDIRDYGSQISAHSSTADELVVFRAGEPELIEQNVSRSRKSTSQPGNNNQEPLSSEDLSRPGEFTDRPVSVRDEIQENPTTATSKPHSRQARSTTAAKVNPKKPLAQSQKSSHANVKATANTMSTSETEIRKTRPNGNTAKEILQHCEPPGFEKKVQKLSQTFPSENLAVLRGILVVSDGNIEMATEQLRAQQPGTSSEELDVSATRGENSSRHNQVEEQFHSASFTSPDGNDISTPQFKKPTIGKMAAAATLSKRTGKSAAGSREEVQDQAPSILTTGTKPAKKYTLKGKIPLAVSKSAKASADTKKKPPAVEKPTQVVKPTPVDKSNLEERSKERPKTDKQDLYDLDASGEDRETIVVTASKKVTKRGAKAPTKAPAKKIPATTKKSTKATKIDPKKRKSAPAAIETTAASTRSKRSAAISASQKIHAEFSDDENEDAEDLVEVRKGQNEKKIASQKTLDLTPQTNAHRTCQSQAEVKPAAETEKVQNFRMAISAASQNSLHSNVEAKLGNVEGVAASSLENQDDSANLQQDNAGELEPHEDSPVDVAAESEPNYYAASPKQCLRKQAQPITKNPLEDDFGASKVPQRADFSTKLGDLLGAIDDVPALEHDYSKIFESMGKTDISPSRHSRMKGKHPSRKLIDATQDPAGLNHSTNSNNSGLKDAVGDTVQIHEEPGTSSCQDRFADEASVVVNVPRDNQTQQSGGGDEISANSNASTPAGTIKTNKAMPDVVRKRKAVDELKNSAKRKQSEDAAIKVNKNLFNGRSQHLETRTQDASEALNNILLEKPLIDDHLTRKPRIVNFSGKGAMNQGPSSVLKSSVNKDVVIQRPEKSTESPVGRKMKRTREDLNECNTETQTPDRPEKRQSISPEDRHDGIQMGGEYPLEYASSPPVTQPTNRRPSKPNSQASRVDQNGSPRALVSAEKVDHFSKVSKKLLQGQTEGGGLNSSLIFGPRPRLASLPKTGPSSPQDVEARYVKHHKLGNGVYEGVETKEVVSKEQALADPFVGGQSRKSSGFTNRLQAGALKETQKSELAHLPKKRNTVPVPDMEDVLDSALKKAAHKTLKVSKQERHSQLPQNVNQAPVYDDQTTLVNAQTEWPSSPSDLTSGSTIEDSRSPLSKRANNTWNVALRPHYAHMSAVAHRLADEVLIRLSKEEDVMGLLVNQYKENGGKLLDLMMTKRAFEKAQIAASVEEQKREMVGAYGEAKTFVNDSEKTLKSSSLSKFEKQWRKEQEGIQRTIYEGRDAIQ